jgi:hypothetical protein
MVGGLTEGTLALIKGITAAHNAALSAATTPAAPVRSEPVYTAPVQSRPAATSSSGQPDEGNGFPWLIVIIVGAVLIGGIFLFARGGNNRDKLARQVAAQRNTDRFAEDESKAARLLDEEIKAGAALATLKTAFPESIWREVNAEFAALTDPADPGSYRQEIFVGQLKVAGEIVKRGEHDSGEASQALDTWEAKYDRIFGVMHAVTLKLEEATAAQTESARKLAELPQLLDQAQNAVQADVAAACRPNLGKARAAYEVVLAKSKETANTVDWIVLLRTLVNLEAVTAKIVDDAGQMARAKNDCSDIIAGVQTALDGIGPRDETNTSKKTLIELGKARNAFDRAKEQFALPADQVDWIELRESLRGLERSVPALSTTAEEEKTLASRIKESPDEMLAKMKAMMDAADETLSRSHAAEADLAAARSELANARSSSGSASSLDMYLYMSAMNNNLESARHHHDEAIRREAQRKAEQAREDLNNSGGGGNFRTVDHRSSWNNIHSGAGGNYGSSSSTTPTRHGAGGGFHSQSSSFHSGSSKSGAGGGFHRK